MQRLGALADQTTPVLTDLGAAAPDINRMIDAARPVLAGRASRRCESLGDAADVGTPGGDQDARPIITDLRPARHDAPSRVGDDRAQPARVAADDTGGIERLMDYVFYQVAAINGFDPIGHYLRAGLIVNTVLDLRHRGRSPGCSANFARPRAASRRAAPRRASTTRVLRRHAPLALAAQARRRLRGQERSTAGGDAAAASERAPPRRPTRAPAPTAGAAHAGARRRADPGAGAEHRPGVGAARLPVRRRRMRRRGSASIAGNPVLIGAATMLVVIVAVFLSYNANSGPAVRADLRAQGRGAERGQPGRGQRRAHRRHARRRGHRRSRPSTAEDGAVIARARRSSSRRPSSRCRATRRVIIRPRSALGLKYVEITRGHLEPAATPTARRSRSPQRDADAGRARRVLQHVRRQDARGVAEQPAPASATRFAGRGASTSTCAIGALNAAAARPHAGDAEPVGPGDASCARFFDRARAHRADRRARRPRRRPSCSSTSTPRSRALARVARPFIQDSISERRRRRSTRAITDFPQPAPVPGQQRGALPRAAPGRRRAARPPRRTSPTRSRSARPRCAATPPFNHRLDAGCFEALRALRRGPAGRRSASNDLTEHGERSLNPTLAYLTPAQTVCNYVTLWFRNVASAAQRGRRATAPGSASSSSPRRRGPNNEGGPSSAPANGADRPGQLPALQPVPEHRVARAAEGVRGRQRAATSPGKTVIGNPPGHAVGHDRDDEAQQ